MHNEIQNALNILKQGGIILYPTDTVWGIGCDASNAEAVKKIFKIKQREDSKALICLVADDRMLKKYVKKIPVHSHLEKVNQTSACLWKCQYLNLYSTSRTENRPPS